MNYKNSTFNRKESGQCHNCKNNIECDEMAKLWYEQGKIPYIPNTIINAEIKCNSRERCATFDDLDNLIHFDKQGYVWVLPLEWIDDNAECEFWVSK